ncbi:MAG: oligosaccharide flippase family protein, partial [Planctomycetales bacterium]|nr:oligosaccharide flippase family protein [Planctomycetales bacterium]
MKGSTAKIAKNAMSLLAGDIFNKASTFCIYALLGRYAGTHGFGQIALGLALLYLFNVFAAGGLPVLITRRVAQNKKRSKYFLRNGYFAATVTAIASTLAMIVFTRIMNYEATTVSVITILAVSIIPFALTMIAEAVVRGREEMHLVALANIPGNGLMVLLGAY